MKSHPNEKPVTPRIDNAEVLSFRLKVPPEELELLAEQQLGLALEEEDGEFVIVQAEGDNYLRFRSIGSDAMLTEVFLCNDEGGVFFHRVLGSLMVRFRGDLHIRLVWNTPDRNRHGDFAEVRISHGQAIEETELSDARGASSPDVSSPAAQIQTLALPSGEDEVDTLLAKARKYWEEYQTMKRARK